MDIVQDNFENEIGDANEAPDFYIAGESEANAGCDKAAPDSVGNGFKKMSFPTD